VTRLIRRLDAWLGVGRPTPADRVLALLDRTRGVWLVAVLTLYAAGYNGVWRMSADAAVHLELGRNLAAGQGFTHPEGWETRVQPGLAWTVAGVFTAVGLDRTDAVLAVMAGLAVVGIALTFVLIRLHAGRPLAIATALALAVSLMWYTHGLRVLTDVPFAVGGLLMLIGHERWVGRAAGAGRRGWGAAVLVAAGFAVMFAFRTVALTFAAAYLLDRGIALAEARRWRSLAGLGAAGVAAVGVGVLAIGQDRRILQLRLVDRLGETLAVELPDHAWQLIRESAAEAVFGVDFGVLALALSPLVIAVGVSLLWRRRLWGLLFLALLAQQLVFDVTDRYFLPLLPVLYYGAIAAAIDLHRLADRRVGRWAAHATLALVLTFLVLPNAVRVADRIRTQHSRQPLADVMGGRWVVLIPMAARMQAELPGDAVVLASPQTAAQLTYLTRRAVVTRVIPAWPRAADAGSLFVLLPGGEPAFDPVRPRGWTLGPTVMEAAGGRDDTRWRLVRVVPTAPPAASGPNVPPAPGTPGPPGTAPAAPGNAAKTAPDTAPAADAP